MKKIFIDCSFIYEHPELNTGIQRVVRKIVENLDKIKMDIGKDIILVNINNNEFSRIDINQLFMTDNVKKEPKKEFKISLKIYFKNIYRAVRTLIVAIFPFKKLNNFLFAPTENFGLNYILYNVFLKPFFFKKVKTNKDNRIELHASKGDILLLLDSTWHLNIWPTVSKLKSKEIKIVSIIYDLIPISHPELCDDFLVKIFNNWFVKSIHYVDGYIAISNTVKNELVIYLESKFDSKIKNKKFDYFILGGDFNYEKKIELNVVRKDLKKIFKLRPTYIVVSTLEPRKNHKYLLDVFDKLWEQSIDINLCIIGRVGWKIDDLIKRVYRHKYYNDKLYHFDNLSDIELKYAYQNSISLLFPSIIEGFGLPIVEGLANKLPVYASDIPIHREVGKDKIGYFDIQNTDDLVQKIINIEKYGIPNELIPSNNFKWLSWEESSRMLLDKILKISK